MIKPWIPPAIISLLLYGLWGFLGAKASQLTNAKTVFIISCIGTMIAGLMVIPLIPHRMEMSMPSLTFSLLTGLATGFGTLMFIYALQRGPAVPIVMLTALYPMITILLTFLFLNQTISLKQGIGILLSLTAIYCLTSA